MEHWKSGFGTTYNPDRKDAFTGVEFVNSIAVAVRTIEELEGKNLCSYNRCSTPMIIQFPMHGCVNILKMRAPCVSIIWYRLWYDKRNDGKL